jgi:CBS domain-containing protein
MTFLPLRITWVLVKQTKAQTPLELKVIRENLTKLIVNALYENIPIAHMSNCGEVNTAITKRAIELSVLKWKRSLLSDLHG